MDTLSINIKIKHRILVFGLLFILVSVVAYYFGFNGSPDYPTHELTKDIFSILSAEVAAIALVYTAVSINQTYEKEKKKYAGEFIKTFRSEEFTKYNIRLRDILKELSKAATQTEKEEVLKKIKSEDEVIKSLGIVLNFFEEIAISIENDMADEAYLKNFFRGIVVGYFDGYRWLINERRKLNNEPYIYSKFETLANKWKGV